MTHMTHKWPHVPTWPRCTRRAHWRICWHCWLLVFMCQQCQQLPAGWLLAAWLLAAWLLAAVGIANIANMVCLLHELTIVSLLHELSMVAGDQVAGGVGGEGRARGPTVTEASRTNFFNIKFMHTPPAQENQCSSHCH